MPGPSSARNQNATTPSAADPNEGVDLDAELRKRVTEVFQNLDQRDYYTLLGVGEKAERKAIKRAYYDLAAVFHPDRYFRKKLGPFKIQMEAIFARLTLAHDALSSADTRIEYDAYLSEQRRAHAIEEHLAAGIAEVRHVEETVERAVRAQDRAPTVASSPAPSSDGQPGSSIPPTRVEVDVATRRDSLAKRLLGGYASRTPSGFSHPAARGERSSGATPNASSQASMPVMKTEDAMNALKRRYEERVLLARAAEARKYASMADAAAASGEAVTAANAFRVAASLAADDTELQRKAQEAREQADALLCDTYMRQARYEEAHSQWSLAARSWASVCKVAPNDANSHERAAHAIAKSKGDLHDAVRLAQRACELEPKNAFFRVTLANCYFAASLALNGRRELERAAQLAPHDDTIRAMIRAVGGQS